MATEQEKQELIEVLKFTPRTYRVRLWGYGGEYVMGTVDRKVYDYFRQRRLDLSEFAWDYDYAEENNIPEDMYPFEPGNWHDCDNMGHCWGVDRNSGTIQVDDENGTTVWEKQLEECMGWDENDEPTPEISCGDEIWIDSQEKGTVVFLGVSSEKGTFFEADIELKMPFDAGKLCINYDEIDGNEIVTSVSYDGVDLDNDGGDTNGKSSEFGFWVAGTLKNGKWERYKNMDDIEYGLTEWFPAKVNPELVGKYNVKTKDGYSYQAVWNGEYWHNDWNDEKIKVKEWQGIAYDPDEHFLRKELDNIQLEVHSVPTAEQADMECVQCDWRGTVDEASINDVDEMVCPECGEPIESISTETENNMNWPFPKDESASVEPQEKKELTAWTVSTYYKKSIEEVEYFVKDGMTIVHRTGWRSGSWTVYTNDGNPPVFDFTTVPGGNDAKDSIDMNSCYVNNIEEVEFNETFDGCYDDTEWPDDIDEDEQAAIEELMDEEGYYDAFEQNDWSHDETEMWIWGPILIEGENGFRKIIEADADGNVVEFKEDE